MNARRPVLMVESAEFLSKYILLMLNEPANNLATNTQTILWWLFRRLNNVSKQRWHHK